MLEVSGLTKRFGGLLANDDISFTVAAGEILGLIGPNGAGKSTLFELITGFQRPDAGDIRFEGASLLKVRPCPSSKHLGHLGLFLNGGSGLS